MYSLLFLAIASFLLSLAITPVLRDLFNRAGLVDLPDNARKFHGRPIPRAGGIAIALSFGLSAGLLLFTPLRGGRIIVQASPSVRGLTSAAAVIVLIGIIDDLIRLNPAFKLGGQVVAALLAYSAGIRVLGIGDEPLAVWLALPITVVWLVGCCNAINLIDGMDGLAAGVSFIATAAMLLAAIMQHNVPLALATVPLAGCLLGFLRYNFSPASIFLGDCGSLLIGFLLGCCGVLWSQKSNTGLGMMAPLVVLSLPLADTGLAIIRRLLRGRPIFQGDRGHIHHRLLNRGRSARKVAFLLYGVCTISAIVSLCLEKKYFAVPMISLFGVLAWLGIQHLGYVEINLLARLVFQGSFQGLVRSHITFHDFEVRACAANTPGEFWEALRSYCAELGLSQIQMRLLGQMYSDGIEVRSISGTLYSVVKLADGDFVELSRQISNSRDDSITAFADKIHRILAAKRTVFLGQTEPAESEPHYVLAGAAAAGN